MCRKLRYMESVSAFESYKYYEYLEKFVKEISKHVELANKDEYLQYFYKYVISTLLISLSVITA